uniref:Uncharacterized protein n=1 Tax=Cacopsylla melanoneura TaxID=428564 RepID=A0A8D8RXE7_9HEMI
MKMITLKNIQMMSLILRYPLCIFQTTITTQISTKQSETFQKRFPISGIVIAHTQIQECTIRQPQPPMMCMTETTMHQSQKSLQRFIQNNTWKLLGQCVRARAGENTTPHKNR